MIEKYASLAVAFTLCMFLMRVTGYEHVPWLLVIAPIVFIVVAFIITEAVYEIHKYATTTK